MLKAVDGEIQYYNDVVLQPLEVRTLYLYYAFVPKNYCIACAPFLIGYD